MNCCTYEWLCIYAKGANAIESLSFFIMMYSVIPGM